MAIYCIGDIQGCDNALHRLLDTIGFLPAATRFICWVIWSTRGPTSADVLRRCVRNDGAIQALLGNHDLHLLAAAHGARKPSNDTLAHVPKRRTTLPCSIGCASNRWHERTPWPAKPCS